MRLYNIRNLKTLKIYGIYGFLWVIFITIKFGILPQKVSSKILDVYGVF